MKDQLLVPWIVAQSQSCQVIVVPGTISAAFSFRLFLRDKVVTYLGSQCK
jgi:hypothetical protein